MKRIALILAMVLLFATGCVEYTGGLETEHPEMPDDLTFRLVWNVGNSSYNSADGTLIKESDATHPEDYTTTLLLNQKEKEQIWEILKWLDIEQYPDEYDPIPGVSSKPAQTLILSVSYGKLDKTVTCRGISWSRTSDIPQGQRFLDAVYGIIDILVGSEEWLALPEFEKLLM